MKKVFLILLEAIVMVGALVGAGYWGYRIGYINGSTGSESRPFFGRSYHMNPNQMPFHRFDEGFGFNQHPMFRPGNPHGFGMRYGYLSPLHILWNVAILALVVWFVYWLFTKSGWQITRKTDAVAKTNSGHLAGN